MLTRIALLVGVLWWLGGPSAYAQSTTGGLRGTVTAADDGAPMIDAEVTLLHVPSGTEKTARTNETGSYAFTGLRVGGPYTIKASMIGFADDVQRDLSVSAGKVKVINLQLSLTEEIIEVMDYLTQKNTSNRTLVTSADLTKLPSISRDPKDMVRLVPEAVVNGPNRELSIGGANNRFNSVTVDGIRQDDDFGLNASGYPTRRSPIALSAIEEISVETSPYDVRYGKFLGGNVNVVTKSGANTFHGELFGTYTSSDFTGKKTRDDEVKLNFREMRYGAMLSGPIVKDRLHFMVNAEGLNGTTPLNIGPAGSGAATEISKVSQADMEAVQRIMRDVYGFDAGQPARSLDETDLKLLAKLDWTISKKHRMSASYQRTAGNTISQAAGTNDSTLQLSSNWFNTNERLQTVTLRAFSDWNDRLSTETEVAGKLMRPNPRPLNGNGFMQATITTADGGSILVGPDRFRHLNQLSNDLWHSKALANYLRDRHLVTAGVEYDYLAIRNLFVPSVYGAAAYDSVAAFEAQNPRSITYQNALSGNANDAAADWNMGTLVAYVQDQFEMASNVTLQAGVRFERYNASNNVVENPRFAERHGFANTATISGKMIAMPRLGISVRPTNRLNVRGGIGLYSGGTPNVWLSNSYTNDGMRVDDVTVRDAAAIAGFDGRNLPNAVQNGLMAGDGNVDALDPNFKIPSVWKTSAGFDWGFDLPVFGKAGRNFDLKANYVYSRVWHGVKWVDLRRNNEAFTNNTPVGTLPDGRPYYDTTGTMPGETFNEDRGYDMLLTNDNRGWGHTASLQLGKKFESGLSLFGSYAFQRVFEGSPANSARSISNYAQAAAALDPQTPELGQSNYERRHRAMGIIDFQRALIKKLNTGVTLFVEARSGQNFSYVYGATGAAGVDNLARLFGESVDIANARHQLFYVPKGDGSDVILNGISEDDFNAYLKKTGLDAYRGQIAPRNGFRSPWYTKLDVRFAQELPNPFKGHRARVYLDIENLGNLLNHNWGRSEAVPFPFMPAAVDVAVDPATGKYVYSNLRQVNNKRVDVLGSVWRMSFGLAYEF